MKGKIYKLLDNISGEFYIGSTTRTLEKRLIEHKCQFKRYIDGKRKIYVYSFAILAENDYSIILLEEIEFNNIKDLKRKEGEYIQNTNCVNKQTVGLTRKETNKKYAQSEKGKLNIKKNRDKFMKTDKGKQMEAKADKKYQQSENGKEAHKKAMKKYRQSLKNKE